VAEYALSNINALIKNTAKITLPLIPLARFNKYYMLVLTTNPTTPASAYTPYMLMLLNIVKPLKPTSGTTNSPWTKFLVHNVPNNTLLDAIKDMIELTYPTIKLIRKPHWLVPTECRLHKGASTIVISLQGALNMANLGTNTLFLYN
jgi:hypothetical protein